MNTETGQLDPIELALRQADNALAADRAAQAPADYAEWLAGHLSAGGQISHPYDYPMPVSWLELQARPDRIPSLYGAMSLEVIVPVGVDLHPADIPDTYHGACGHSTFYFMDGYKLSSSIGWVPLYTDVRDLLR